MNLSFSIDGREALPVRAVPWVVGAEMFTRNLLLPPSLIVLTARTACDAKDIISCSPLLRLYRYDKGRVLPVTSERLDAIAPEHDFQSEADEPLRESSSRLPAGVFVFLDELRRFVDWLNPPGCHDGVCRDSIALNTSPDLPDEMIERLQEGFVAPRPNAASERSSPRKILFWLAPNEILIPADQVPGAIADALHPRPNRDGGLALNDPDTTARLLAERKHAKLLKAKFPSLPDDYEFRVGDLNDYLASLGLESEVRRRIDPAVTKPVDPEGRWLGRQFTDGFISVRDSTPFARHFPAEVSNERCVELANEQELHVDHWIELVGIGIGAHDPYMIEDKQITFRKWEHEYISDAPLDWQMEMQRDNRIAPHLTFPCTPVELMHFIDTAIGIHCFSVPDAFRQAMTSKISGAPENDEAIKSRLKESNKSTPGKLPNVSAGRLAVKAAWEIELETGRAASRDDIMNRLQEWATKGIHSETLIRAVKEKRAIEWHTKDGKGKFYDIEACGKTIEAWNKSRA